MARLFDENASKNLGISGITVLNVGKIIQLLQSSVWVPAPVRSHTGPARHETRPARRLTAMGAAGTRYDNAQKQNSDFALGLIAVLMTNLRETA